MKKVCGALAIGLLIAVNGSAEEISAKRFKEMTGQTFCEFMNESISMVLKKPKKKYFSDENNCKILIEYRDQSSKNYFDHHCQEDEKYAEGYREGYFLSNGNDMPKEVIEKKQPSSVMVQPEYKVSSYEERHKQEKEIDNARIEQHYLEQTRQHLQR